MENSQVLLAMLAVILAVGVQTGYALSCYECNSHWKYDGKVCDDPIDTTKLELVDCDEKYGAKLGANYTMCRKMNQNVEGDKRIFRSCAITGDDKCVDRTGTKQIAVKYCECFGDGCNSAPGFTTITSLLTATVVSVVALVVRS